jgi:phosphate-selective porin OprO/OprP
MRYSILAAALAAAMGSTSFAAAAQSSELEELKAQLAALQAKVIELEERSDAQSGVNIDTAGQLDKLNTGSTKIDTKGGIKVTSADGKFEASLGGRIHFDAYAFDRDLADVTGTTEFRRARLTLAGKAFGWDYKVEQDFGAGNNLEGLRDVFIAKSALGGKFTIGHFKPYRSMEELTSSNEILMMERPFASATGLFNGRQFQQGIGYQRSSDSYTAGFTAFNLRGASGTRNEGVGASGRVTFAPINNDNNTLHFGGWASVENQNKGSANLVASANYAGRRGPSQAIATVTGLSGDQVTAYALEAAGSFGPLFFQSEYANSTFEQPLGNDQDIQTWYVQGAWLLNGGHRVYKSATGVFGAPKVADKGLWELTARYDFIENEDIADREVTSWIVGMNYYVNPNLRFMFNYTKGENEVNGDETAQYALRTQFNW